MPQKNLFWTGVISNNILGEVVVMGKDSSSLQSIHRSKANQLSLEELLAKQNEVDLIRRGAYAQEPIIRSYRDGQINITVDGMRIFSACTDRMDPSTSYIETSNLGTVECESSCHNGGGYGGGIGLSTYCPTPGGEKQLEY